MTQAVNSGTASRNLSWESRVENALMLVLFAVTLVAIVSILLLVGEQVHSVVSAVSDGVHQ